MELLTPNASFMKRLRRYAKKTVTREQIAEMQAQDEQRFAQEIAERQHHLKMEAMIGRSAILPAYLECSINNYVVTCEGQQQVRQMAINYIQSFDDCPKNFIFSGSTGTGKNHIASAIALELIRRGHSVVLISVPELMMQLRACYDKKSTQTERGFLDGLISLDLLIIDEVGVMRGTSNEHINLNHLVDARQANLKPTGMLTNLSLTEFRDVMGERISDRMRTGILQRFNWDSYRQGS